MKIRTYSELSRLPTYEQRFEYLRICGSVGRDTFGFDRYLNQSFYTSREWKKVRNDIIVRDNGCDLAVKGFEIFDKIIVHHMNPIVVQDMDDISLLLNPQFLICVSHQTHNAIHYGTQIPLATSFVDRKPGDTCPWR